MALDAAQLATILTPDVRDAFVREKADFLARSGGIFRREALQVAWPFLVAEVPAATHAGCDLVLSRLGQYSVADVITLIVEHSRAKGSPLHPSFAEYRNG